MDDTEELFEVKRVKERKIAITHLLCGDHFTFAFRVSGSVVWTGMGKKREERKERHSGQTDDVDHLQTAFMFRCHAMPAANEKSAVRRERMREKEKQHDECS